MTVIVAINAKGAVQINTKWVSDVGLDLTFTFAA